MPRTDPWEKGCRLDGCNGCHYAKGWCQLHYNRIKATGQPGPIRPLRPGRQPRSRRRCDIEGCDGWHRARGYCSTHYQRWLRYGPDGVGGPERLAPARKWQDPVCTVGGCDRPTRTHNLCHMHYMRQFRGIPLDAPVRPPVKPKREVGCVDCGGPPLAGGKRCLRCFQAVADTRNPPVARRSCGTSHGYKVHSRSNERACDGCRRANTERSRKLREGAA